MQSNDRGGPYSTDVVFAGEWDEEREAVLGTMTDFKLSIFGPGWGRMCRLQQVRQKVRGDGLFGPDLAGVYKGARVVFNHLRPHNGSAHNMRTMEIAGIGGGVQLVRRTKEQAQDLFAENASIFCYEGSEELRVKLEWLLGRSESHLREVSSQARAIVQRQHLLLDRMKKLISDVTSI
jgi:spore maturation protein CgeB